MRLLVEAVEGCGCADGLVDHTQNLIYFSINVLHGFIGSSCNDVNDKTVSWLSKHKRGWNKDKKCPSKGAKMKKVHFTTVSCPTEGTWTFYEDHRPSGGHVQTVSVWLSDAFQPGSKGSSSSSYLPFRVSNPGSGRSSASLQWCTDVFADSSRTLDQVDHLVHRLVSSLSDAKLVLINSSSTLPGCFVVVLLRPWLSISLLGLKMFSVFCCKQWWDILSLT